ncbi:hypothetical protein K2173_024320 [Erythroxylum novogranatense]|uniref:Phytocyanin domain-containing protein n=1 Tax=Erythroxylum novogranatense TaxID=1862640 RepID=A0AAV8SUU4_9ROSI|nr:hypothetical protein K2173_024320 [Erythroxylum novogranatense]
MKVSNLASLMGVSICSFLFLASMHAMVVDATRVFKVGDELGWKEPPDSDSAMYSLWAGRNRFLVGDSLSFEYKNDSVLEVEKWGYYHCNNTQPIAAFNNGRSLFKLDRPGPFYFISGNSDHCLNGQRLLVEVMGLHHLHTPPPSGVVASPDLPPTPHPSSAPVVSPELAPSPIQSSGSIVSTSTITLVSLLFVTAVAYILL